jgi:hypothetical protein
MEAWKPVVGYEGIYSVSDAGRVRRDAPGQGARPGAVLRPSTMKSGYKQVTLYLNGLVSTRRIHRLMAEAFLGPCPQGMEACHENDIPHDNRISNIRWDTHKGNCSDRAGRRRKPRKPRTVCKNGLHDMSTDNTGISHRGSRYCVACRKENDRRNYRRGTYFYERSEEDANHV